MLVGVDPSLVLEAWPANMLLRSKLPILFDH
uniref:Uncharacterized protein n=1 Tax=Anopheles minimus TaxID=112268 RepID=A0A182WQ50_9DIPT